MRQITVEDLKGKSLFLGIPCYGGQMSGITAKSLVDLQAMCLQLNLPFKLFCIFNESLVTRARNYICDEFLRSTYKVEDKEVQYSHLMFIDADIGFNPNDVMAMLGIADNEHRIVGAPYTKKALATEQMVSAVQLGLVSEKNPQDIEQFAGDFVFNPERTPDGKILLSEPTPVLEAGTGFLIIEREVFTEWAEAYPQFYYKPDHNRSAAFDGSHYIHAFFDTAIHSEAFLGKLGIDLSDNGKWSDRYLSEDYFFCQTVRAIGIKVWYCPWIKLVHFGSYPFSGQLTSISAIQNAQMQKGQSVMPLSPAPKAQAPSPETPFPLTPPPMNRKARRAAAKQTK